MIDLFDLLHFICSAVGAVFDFLDVLNVIYTVGQFFCWCAQSVVDIARDLFMRRP